MAYTPRILIIDDEPQICKSLTLLLQRQGYDMHSANSGQEGVALLEAGAYDLLLLDMFIPDMDGFQIMDHINRQGIDLLIIVITGNASIESAVKALKKGAFDYLKKPFEYEELLKRVGNALNQKKLAHEKQIMRGKLERAEERNQFLVQNSPDIIYMLDEEGRFLFVNGTVRNLLGYDPAQLTGEPFSYFVYPEDIDKAESVLAAGAGGNGVLRRREVRLSVRDTPDDFKLFELEHGAITLSDAAEGEAAFGTYGVARDITYRKQLEQQLLHAQKMEAIGTLAGGIAHDFNNILMGIMGYTSLLITQVDPEVPYYAKLKNIEQHVRSGANLTKQLLGFARGGNADIKPANINTIVEKTVGMFGRSRREITIAVELAGTWTIEADSGQIEQVLLNLYLNAWQAMENGGKLFLATGNAAVDPLQAERLNIAAGSYVFVSVRDTGCGMDDETLQRIFDPFFTTKEPGTGTGLGLASTYGIVKNHLGGINVESSPGQGTTFTLYLPASEKSIAAEEELPSEIAGGTGTIMLVDDEEAMLEVGVEILETLGYKVFSAGSGDKALEIFGHQSDNIDLVIVDMIMPGMGGGELFDRLRAAKPLVKVLLASGYSLDGDAGKIMERGCNGFLQKPFGLKELSHKLKEILTGY